MKHQSSPESRWIIALALAAFAAVMPCGGKAMADVDTEEKFETVFTSAGYSTALGAGIGAALLAFTTEPKDNIHYITTGAAAGFLGGTALGGYLVLIVDSGSHPGRIDPRQRAVDVAPGKPDRPGLRLDWNIAQF